MKCENFNIKEALSFVKKSILKQQDAEGQSGNNNFNSLRDDVDDLEKMVKKRRKQVKKQYQRSKMQWLEEELLKL